MVLENGFKINKSNKCVYSKFNNKKGVMICLYVDDMFIFGTDINEVVKTKKFLSINFDMKDMGEADVIPGIKIVKDNNFHGLTQSNFIEKILKSLIILIVFLFPHHLILVSNWNKIKIV